MRCRSFLQPVGRMTADQAGEGDEHAADENVVGQRCRVSQFIDVQQEIAAGDLL